MSLYHSPEEAIAAPEEEFLYLACLHEGTDVDAPDFLAVVDTENQSLLATTPIAFAASPITLTVTPDSGLKDQQQVTVTVDASAIPSTNSNLILEQ